MKIGIITLPLHVNYGGILQAYALQTILCQLGHDVSVITPKREYSIGIRTFIFSIPKRIIKKILGKKTTIFQEWNWNKDIIEMSVFVRPFINKYIRQDNRPLSKIRKEDYGGYVVGSDQIWRPIYITRTLRSTIPNAYLAFARNWDVKKISYAASFGTDQWEYNSQQTEQVKKLIGMFDAVSVREASGVDLCKTNLDVNAEWVLDPTLLLSVDDYVKLEGCAPKSQGNMMCYILDMTENKQGLISSIAKDKGLIPFTVGAQIDNWNLSGRDRIQPPVEYWLRGFHDAGFVVTDSFHACVFSIIYRKPFVVLGNEERGLSRFNSLLTLFGLERNLISSDNPYNPKYDYSIPDNAYERLKTYQDHSLKFLLDALNGTEVLNSSTCL